MNITPSTIYWITRLDGLKELCILPIFLGLLGIVSCIVFCCAYYDINKYAGKEALIYSIYCVVLCFLAFILGVSGRIFIPTTKEMCAIYVIPSVVNNEKVQDIANGTLDGIGNLVKLSNKWIEENLDKNTTPLTTGKGFGII